MKYLRRVLWTYSILLMIIACRKTTIDAASRTLPTAPEAGQNDWVAGVTGEVAELLEKAYQDKDAYLEVNAAILSHYYEDERVLLKDLLFPENSALYKCESFKIFKVKEGIFKKRFLYAMNNGSYPILKPALAPLFPNNTGKTVSGGVADHFRVVTPYPPVLSDSIGAAIYFPYSENFDAANKAEKAGKLNLIRQATIVSTDREADSGPGREPFNCGLTSGNFCYRNIMVNDSFAITHPTHIVGIGAKVGNTAFLGPVPTLSITRMYHGWSRLTRQMDRLISFTGNGGGSEIKVARISGYLAMEDQQVTNFSGDVITVYYTRSDIRNERWKRIYSVWDPNWDKADLEQVYAVYEDDTQGKHTINGSLSTSVSLPGKPSPGKATGEIGFKIDVVTQDDIITQRKWRRESFMKDGLSGQGWGTIFDPNDFLPVNKDWPIYDGGTIWQYTMAWKSY